MKKVVLLMCLLVAGNMYGLVGEVDTLERGQAALGYEYAESEQNFIIYGSGKYDGLLETDLSLNTGTISYGVTDNVEISGGLGYADNSERVMGLGLKAKLKEWDKLSIGASANLNWTRFDITDIQTKRKCWFKQTSVTDLTVSAIETSLALAASYDVTDSLSIYGGPIVYMIDGSIETKSNKDFTGTVEDGSIKEDSGILGYAGASLDVGDFTLAGEFQFADDHQLWGASVIFKF